MSTYREVCGGLRGMLAHQAAGEEPCGWCLYAERAARLAAEGIPRREHQAERAASFTAEASCPQPLEPAGEFLPAAEVEAAERRAVLLAEVEAFERDHPGAGSRDTGHRHLWRVA